MSGDTAARRQEPFDSPGGRFDAYKVFGEHPEQMIEWLDRPMGDA